MKRIVKIILVGSLLILCSSAAYAQKFGHINRMEIMSVMVENEGVMEKLQKLQDQYIQQLEAVQVEFNNKMDDLQKNASTYSDAIKQVKNRELSELQNRAQQLQQMGQEEISTTEQSLVAPITEKVNNAIKKVGADGGYTAIFDNSGDIMPYFDESVITDVTALVKKELGI